MSSLGIDRWEMEVQVGRANIFRTIVPLPRSGSGRGRGIERGDAMAVDAEGATEMEAAILEIACELMLWTWWVPVFNPHYVLLEDLRHVLGNPDVRTLYDIDADLGR